MDGSGWQQVWILPIKTNTETSGKACVHVRGKKIIQVIDKELSPVPRCIGDVSQYKPVTPQISTGLSLQLVHNIVMAKAIAVFSAWVVVKVGQIS